MCDVSKELITSGYTNLHQFSLGTLLLNYNNFINSNNSEVVATSYNAPQLLNIAADKSKSGRKQGNADLRKFNEYIITDHEHLHLTDNINFETLRLTDVRSGDDDGAHLGDILGRYGHFLFSNCKLSWKTSDQYVSAMKGLIIGRFPTLTLLIYGFYKQLMRL